MTFLLVCFIDDVSVTYCTPYDGEKSKVAFILHNQYISIFVPFESRVISEMVRSYANALHIVLLGLCLTRFGLAFQQQQHRSIDNTNPVATGLFKVSSSPQTTALYASPVNPEKSRRAILRSAIPAWAISSLPLVSSFGNPSLAAFDDSNTAGTAATTMDGVEVIPKGDIKKLFNEARAMESQGNMPAAQRIYAKITKVAPRVSETHTQTQKALFCIGLCYCF